MDVHSQLFIMGVLDCDSYWFDDYSLLSSRVLFMVETKELLSFKLWTTSKRLSQNLISLIIHGIKHFKNEWRKIPRKSRATLPTVCFTFSSHL